MPVSFTISGDNYAHAYDELVRFLRMAGEAVAPKSMPPTDATADKPARRRRSAAEEPKEAETAPAEESQPEIGVTELKAKLIEAGNVTGDPAVPVAILAAHGAKKISEVPADKIQAVYDDAQKAIDAKNA